MIAEVIVDIANRQVNRTFDYSISPELEEVVEVGMRVKIPFRTRVIIGYVINIKENSDISELKAIQEPLDIIPSINRELLDLAFAIASTTNSFVVHCIEMMIPSALRVKYQKKIKMVNEVSDLRDIFKSNTVIFDETLLPFLRRIKQEIKNGNLELVYDIKDKVGKKTKKMIMLNYVTEQKKGANQAAVIEFLTKSNNCAEKKVLIDSLNISSAVVNTLIKKGIVSEYEEEIYREIILPITPSDKTVSFNEHQHNVYETIMKSIDCFRVFLLHGVTGSGKTEIYLNVIEKVVSEGKEAIVLVPEISLTTQMIYRFRGRFGKEVAILHSGLSIGEKYDEWRKIQKKEVKIALGVRSAIFAPFTNIGIIIVDEEHEQSYQQDENPKYNAVEVALTRGRTHNCPVILGSATPLIEHYNKALNGEYTLLKLPVRANEMNPDVIVQSLKEEFSSGNKTIFSRVLKDLIDDRLEKKEQIILLLNKRGHSSFVLCRECGMTLNCPHCDVTLTYYQKNNKLQCNYCGYTTANVDTCPECGSKHIRYVGIGTEKVEEEVKKNWPNARTLRMDADTTTKKGSHAEILSEFSLQKADVLIGTQMIAKGLDFPSVTLVGVVMADLSLKFPDFRSSERTFQLISQIVGRTGRHEKKGIAVIQTYNENHYSIRYAAKGDYFGFYSHEMKFRRLGDYLPYKNLLQIIVSHPKYDVAKAAALSIHRSLAEAIPNSTIFEPTFATIGKIKDRFRISVVAKYEGNIDSFLNELSSFYQAGDIDVSIDKNVFRA